MDKDEEIDIRNFFKPDCISEDTGFILSPAFYIEQTTRDFEKDKEKRIKNYITSFENKKKFVVFIVKMANELTKRTLT